MSSYVERNGDVALHPGYYIEEFVEDSGLSQEDFAKRLGVSPKTLGKLINGEQDISPEMALKLSNMLGPSAEFWLNLQHGYEKKLALILKQA